MKKFPWWEYIKIELEINGIVTDTRYIRNKDYDRMLDFFRVLGKSQPYEWSIHVKRHIAKKSMYQRNRRRKIENDKRRSERLLNKGNLSPDKTT